MKVVQRDTDKITPYEGNPRVIPEEAVRSVATSLMQFGFRQPIVIDAAGIIIVGHTRWLAAKQLDLKQVPVHVADLSPEHAKAYRLADNRVGEYAAWDEGLLSLELGDLHELDESLPEFTGFTSDQLADYIGLVAPGDLPDLPSGERQPFKQLTFILHDDQVELLKAALDLAKQEGEFDGPNQNSNGNALARVVEHYIAAKSNS